MLNIYVTNLGKYNEGELIGEWVELPVDIDEDFPEVLERIGVSDEPAENGQYYEEYFITDYECDFGLKVGEYESIEFLNEVAEEAENIDDFDVFRALIEYGFDFEEATDIIRNGNYIYHVGDTMEEVAENAYYETGMIDEIPEEIQPYIDWEKIGRDWDINGTFVEGCGFFVEVF